MVYTADYRYIFNDAVEETVLPILGSAPKRWGRMDAISRLALVEIGRLLGSRLMLDDSFKVSRGMTGGLIGATRHGCLVTDLDFCRTMRHDANLASPILFGYTLPNIALAEVASHFGLTGPVYSLFTDNPTARAEEEARRWLNDRSQLDFMICGELDIGGAAREVNDPEDLLIRADFAVVR